MERKAKEATELAALQAERDTLARFKKWVHDYLDGKGIPHHPPGTHGAEGCRIGDRMDFVFAELQRQAEQYARDQSAYALMQKGMESQSALMDGLKQENRQLRAAIVAARLAWEKWQSLAGWDNAGYDALSAAMDDLDAVLILDQEPAGGRHGDGANPV